MKKIFMTLVLSLMMAANIFAVDWVKVSTFETEEMETIDVYFDYDSTEPFNINKESIRYFLFLQDIYDEVEVCLENVEDWWLYSEAIEYNCYAIRIEYGNFCVYIYIHDDDTVTVYSYRLIKDQAEE